MKVQERKQRNMYMKDLRHKMTLRLNEDLFNYVNEMSEIYQLSPSDFIRQCIGLSKHSYDQTNQILEKNITGISDQIGDIMKGVLENGTDRKTDSNNKL